jgi:hypothetical protein
MSDKVVHSYFGGRGEKVDPVSSATEEHYMQKRERLARLYLLDPKSQEYKEAAENLCCCSKPWVNAGCPVHGPVSIVRWRR